MGCLVLVVTNRQLGFQGEGLKIFASTPSERGPHELRFVKVRRVRNKWRTEILPDQLSRNDVRQCAESSGVTINAELTWYGSLMAAVEIFRQAREQKANVLLYIPGLMSIEEIVQSAETLEKLYRLRVIVFVYPSSAGGVIGSGDFNTLFRDIKVSATALERTLKKIKFYRMMFLDPIILSADEESLKKYPVSYTSFVSYRAELLKKKCPTKLSVLAHGAGAYLLQQVLQEPLYEEELSNIDNVVISSGDVEARDHNIWVDRIESLGTVYVTINEDDCVLRESRKAIGSERLGEDTTYLSSQRAVYVNFTNSPHVQDSHVYFYGKTTTQDRSIKDFFCAALNGESAERHLSFSATGRVSKGQAGEVVFTALFGDTHEKALATSRLSRHRSCFFGFDYKIDENFALMEKIQEILTHEDFGVEVLAPIHARTDVDLLRDIDNQLHSAHFGLMEISTNNANVFVETGFLLGLGKPVIILRNKGGKKQVPFNIGTALTIEYKKRRRNGVLRFEGLEEGLKGAVYAVLKTSSRLLRSKKWVSNAKEKIFRHSS
jgi:hypothetical protein